MRALTHTHTHTGIDTLLHTVALKGSLGVVTGKPRTKSHKNAPNLKGARFKSTIRDEASKTSHASLHFKHEKQLHHQLI